MPVEMNPYAAAEAMARAEAKVHEALPRARTARARGALFHELGMVYRAHGKAEASQIVFYRAAQLGFHDHVSREAVAVKLQRDVLRTPRQLPAFLRTLGTFPDVPATAGIYRDMATALRGAATPDDAMRSVMAYEVLQRGRRKFPQDGAAMQAQAELLHNFASRQAREDVRWRLASNLDGAQLRRMAPFLAAAERQDRADYVRHGLKVALYAAGVAGAFAAVFLGLGLSLSLVAGSFAVGMTAFYVPATVFGGLALPFFVYGAIYAAWSRWAPNGGTA